MIRIYLYVVQKKINYTESISKRRQTSVNFYCLLLVVVPSLLVVVIFCDYGLVGLLILFVSTVFLYRWI